LVAQGHPFTPKPKKKRENDMRLESAEEAKTIVTIKQAKRDNRQHLDKDGKKVANKMFGKIIYETVESIDVYDAKPEEVLNAVNNGLRAAAKK
jgi:hypothetical protein